LTPRTTHVILPAMLRSPDGQRQRACKIAVDKHQMTVDEAAAPIAVAYSHLAIADSDDWPDGDYQVIFGGQKELLTKEDGQYSTRR
jgi:hypothetical protein